MEEQFARGGSFIHQRDTRCKIVVAIICIITVALAHSFAAISLALGISLSLVILSKLPLFPVLRRILLVNSFTLFLWVSLPLTYGGEVTLSFLSISLSYEGVLLAARITLKTNTIILLIVTLLSTSTIADLGHALEKLRFSRKLCFILLFSYRYVFVIHQEFNRLLRAAKMRCFSPRTTIHTYRTYAYLFAMTLVKSYNRSQRVHQAMLLRGFSGKLMSLQSYNLTSADFMFIFSALLSIIAILLLNFN